DTAGADANGVILIGDRALVACGDDGVQVLDVTDVAHPSLIKSIETEGYAIAFAAQPGKVVVADYNGGLLVLPTVEDVQLTLRVETTPGVLCTLEMKTNMNESVPWTPLFTTS